MAPAWDTISMTISAYAGKTLVTMPFIRLGVIHKRNDVVAPRCFPQNQDLNRDLYCT